MDVGTTSLFLVITVLGVNRLVMQAPALRRHAYVFWALQGMTAGAGLWILVRGLPGFAAMPAVSWVVGLLFMLHAAKNLQSRAAMGRELARQDADARRERATELREQVVEE